MLDFISKEEVRLILSLQKVPDSFSLVYHYKSIFDQWRSDAVISRLDFLALFKIIHAFLCMKNYSHLAASFLQTQRRQSITVPCQISEKNIRMNPIL